MKKRYVIISFFLCFIILIIIFFLKGPIITKSQALYFGYSVMKEEFKMTFKELLEYDFIAEKREDGTWWVINRQMYNPQPGMEGGGAGVIFSVNRKDVQPFILD